MIPGEHVLSLVGLQEAVAARAPREAWSAEDWFPDGLREMLQEFAGESRGFVETEAWTVGPDLHHPMAISDFRKVKAGFKLEGGFAVRQRVTCIDRQKPMRIFRQGRFGPRHRPTSTGQQRSEYSVHLQCSRPHIGWTERVHWGKSMKLQRISGVVLMSWAVTVWGCGGDSGTDPIPVESISATAENYLNAALDIMQAHSINRYVIDWRYLREVTFSRAGAAQTTSDTYDAIRFALRELGDNHSFFRPPGGQSMELVSPAAVERAPTAQHLGEGLGYVSVSHVQRWRR